MTTTAWSSERARLNHDVLCNQVLTELVSVRSAPRTVAPLRLAMWLRQVPAYKLLVSEAEDALDGGRIVDARMFDCWERERRELFRGVFRRVFSSANRIPELVGVISDLIVGCEKMAFAFLNTPIYDRSVADAVALESGMQHLSRAISALPRPVLVHSAFSERGQP